MSLTATDLHAIRTIIEEEARKAIQIETRPIVQEEIGKETAPISVKLTILSGKLTALENDIKEIYSMITELQKSTITDKKFSQRSVEQKVLTLHAELLNIARQARITLPKA